MPDQVCQAEELVPSQNSQRRAKPTRLLSSGSPLTTGQVALRLGLAFSFLVVLLIGVGDLSLRRIDRFNGDLQDMTGRQWTKLRLSRQAINYSNRNSRITMQVFLLKDKDQIDSLLAARVENTKPNSRASATLVRRSVY